MSATDRKTMKQRAQARLKKTKNWILITMDREEAPVYAFDISKLQNKEDIRHVIMHNLTNEIEGVLQELYRFGEQKIQERIIEQTKEARSKALAEFAKDAPEIGRVGFVQTEFAADEAPGRVFGKAPVPEPSAVDKAPAEPAHFPESC